MFFYCLDLVGGHKSPSQGPSPPLGAPQNLFTNFSGLDMKDQHAAMQVGSGLH